MGSITRKITVQASLGININRRPYLKITEPKKSGRVAQVVEHLASKYKALSSNPSTIKKNPYK
jgi:hypothetical protein